MSSKSSDSESSSSAESQQLNEATILNGIVYSAPKPLLPLPPMNSARKHSNKFVNNKYEEVNFYSKFDTKFLKRLSMKQSPKQELIKSKIRKNRQCLAENPNFRTFRRHLIEFLYGKFAGHAKINDDILIKSIMLFDHYFSEKYKQKMGSVDFVAGKKFLVAALVLFSKTEDVRHLPVKVAAELANLMDYVITEHERKLFIQFNGILLNPSVCCYIKAIIEEMKCKNTDQNIQSLLYHLSMYILTLNILEQDYCIKNCEKLGYACVYVGASILQFHSKFNNLKPFSDQKEDEDFCLQVMCRAIKGCQKENSFVCKYYTSIERCCAHEILLTTSETSIGKFLSQ